MKKVKILSITSNGSLIFEDNGNIKESNFQGFSLSTDIPSRHLFASSLQIIDCTFSKNSNIRFHDKQTINQMLKAGVFKVKADELAGSKSFTEEQKTMFKESAAEFEQKKPKVEDNVLDMVSERGLLAKYYPQIKQTQGSIFYLKDQMIIKIQLQQKPAYLPVKLQNIDHFFELIDPKSLMPFILSNQHIKLKLSHPVFNLIKNRYECEVVLPLQSEKAILQNGWGSLRIKNLNKINPKIIIELRQIEKKARISHVGIFKKPFEILNLIYTKDNMVGIVEEIVEGFIYKIRNKNQQTIKIELANVFCPIQNQVGAFECREFARKNLIGRQVNVFMKKDNKFNLLASVVRSSDNKDLETLMVENGYGFVKEELKGTMIVSKIEALQKKTKIKNKGIHNEKMVGSLCFEDFTTTLNKKDKLVKRQLIQKKMSFLDQLQPNTEAVIEKIINATTFIARVDSHNKLLRIKLDGVSRIEGNPILPEIKSINEALNIYAYRNFFQRTVSLNLNDFSEKENSFVGDITISMKGSKKTFQSLLISEGFVYINGFFHQQWQQLEEKAKKVGKNIWTSNMKAFTKSSLLEEQPNQFKGKVSWVQNGEIIYVQPECVYDKLDEVYEILHKEQLPSLKGEHLLVGSICGSKFQDEMSRAKIISINQNHITVFFIDWGNKENVKYKNLYEIPESLQYIPGLCCQLIVDVVKPMKLLKLEKQYIEKVRDIFMEDEVRIVKNYSNVVDIFTSQNQHLNISLIEEGWLKADISKIMDEKQRDSMHQLMQKLRKGLVGIWEVQDYSDQQLENDYDY